MPELATPKKKKTGWTTVAFGDVVQLSKERSSDPEADGYERYVGLEHIDPGELRIRRWGDIADGVTFTSVFHPGQVLFGKRRAYQRKVAVADFSGVCSGDIYVLEPKGDALLPELLPFICQTDAFFSHAVGTSAGSLSPRTNWKSLADFAFALPPIEEQRRMVNIMVAAQTCLDVSYKLTESLQTVHDSHLAHFVESLSDRTSIATLGEVAAVKYGLTINQQRRSASTQGPYLRVANVGRGVLLLDEVKAIGKLPGDEEYELRDGDVLVVEGHANPEEIGRAAIWSGEIPGAMHQNHLIRVRCGPDLNPRFLTAVINSPHGRRYFRSCAKSSSGLNTINSAVVKNLRIPLPKLDLQRQVATRCEKLAEVLSSAVEHRSHYLKIVRQVIGDLKVEDA